MSFKSEQIKFRVEQEVYFYPRLCLDDPTQKLHNLIYRYYGAISWHETSKWHTIHKVRATIDSNLSEISSMIIMNIVNDTKPEWRRI